jgi:hypothetical protein
MDLASDPQSNYSSIIEKNAEKSTIYAIPSPNGQGCCVPPTGLRRSKLLGRLREHVRSVARQVGPEDVRHLVEDVLAHEL